MRPEAFYDGVFLFDDGFRGLCGLTSGAGSVACLHAHASRTMPNLVEHRDGSAAPVQVGWTSAGNRVVGTLVQEGSPRCGWK